MNPLPTETNALLLGFLILTTIPFPFLLNTDELVSKGTLIKKSQQTALIDDNGKFVVVGKAPNSSHLTSLEIDIQIDARHKQELHFNEPFSSCVFFRLDTANSSPEIRLYDLKAGRVQKCNLKKQLNASIWQADKAAQTKYETNR